MIQDASRISDLDFDAKLAFSRASSEVCRIADATDTDVIVWDDSSDVMLRIPPECPLMRNPDIVRLECEHARWLEAFDSRHLVAWKKLLDDDYEAALTEAGVRRLLQEQGVAVEPNTFQNVVGKCPDFRCEIGGSRYYVEVTCIKIATARRKTGISDKPSGASMYSPLTEAIQAECKSKTRQCAGLDAPILLAIGTFHGFAGAVCFDKQHLESVLIGEPFLSFDFDTTLGHVVGEPHNATSLKGAAFVAVDRDGECLKPQRQSISGILFVSFSSSHPRGRGVLNPGAQRTFQLHMLPGIEFGTSSIDISSRQVTVSWSSVN